MTDENIANEIAQETIEFLLAKAKAAGVKPEVASLALTGTDKRLKKLTAEANDAISQPIAERINELQKNYSKNEAEIKRLQKELEPLVPKEYVPGL